MKPSITIAEAYRLLQALTAISKGFGEPPKPVIETIPGRLTVARNIKVLRMALEPAEEEIVKERDRLLEGMNPAELEKGMPLSVRRQFDAFSRAVNEQKVVVELGSLAPADLALDRFDGEAAISALSVLDGVLFVEG
jgi:hypothetical protein